MLELGIKFTLAYGLGAVMGGLVVGYLRGRVDIRNVGSGNAGGTNALRTQGKWFALWVMLIDIGKGIAAVVWVPALVIPAIGIDAEINRDLVVYAVAYAAVLGHVFPVWFGFRGGKGGATAAGLLCYFAPMLRRRRDHRCVARGRSVHRHHCAWRSVRIVRLCDPRFAVDRLYAP
jgi:glycerol-3-phosphate acyltransferase PlsY